MKLIRDDSVEHNDARLGGIEPEGKRMVSHKRSRSRRHQRFHRHCARSCSRISALFIELIKN